MSIELYCKCEECRTDFYSQGEAVYCPACWDYLQKENADLQQKVEDLEYELKKAQEEIEKITPLK